MRMTVAYLDGSSAEANIIPGDTVRLERKYNISAAKADDDPRVEYVYFLAYTALTRVKVFPADFETFLDLVADISVEEQPDPLEPNG